MENELAHHGVVGMKWGVRRYQNADGSLTSAGKKRRSQSKTQSKETASNPLEALDNMSDDDKKALDAAAKTSKNVNAVINGANLAASLTSSTASALIANNAVVAAGAAAAAPVISAIGPVSAAIVVAGIGVQQLNNYVNRNKELKHHGILGMKWGVRRTPAQLGHVTGAIRRKKNKGKFTKADGKYKGTGEKKAAQTKKERKQEVLDSRSAKKLYENADLFTDKELQSAYNRLVLEKNIKSLGPTEISKGEKFIDDTIKWTKKANDLATAGTNAYNTFAKIYNAFSPSGSLPTIGEQKKKIFDYGKLRDKALKSLSDDELKALNTRDAMEEKYNSRYNKSSESKSSNSSSSSGGAKEESPAYTVEDKKSNDRTSGYEDVINVNATVSDPVVKKQAQIGERYIAGLLPAPKKNN